MQHTMLLQLKRYFNIIFSYLCVSSYIPFNSLSKQLHIVLVDSLIFAKFVFVSDGNAVPNRFKDRLYIILL